MRLGIICSAGGSPAFAAAALCPHVEFQVITDRPCGAEAACERLSIPFHRVEEKSTEAFSIEANRLLSENGGCDAVVLLFSRVVSTPLLTEQNLLNTHPSLLPSFPGLGAVGKAMQGGVCFFGATLHHAIPEVDAGRILAQACQPMPPDASLDSLNHLSFLHRTALILLAIELMESGRMRWVEKQPVIEGGLAAGDRLNPMLTNQSYLAGLRKLQRPGLSFL